MDIIVIVFFDPISDLALRGEKDIFIEIGRGDQNNLAGRIHTYWLPSIYYITDSMENFLLGSRFRGFNQFLYYISGVPKASHNIFVTHLACFGGIVTILWAVIWYQILVKTYLFLRRIRSSKVFKTRELDLLKTVFFSLMLYFLSSNLANINDDLFMCVIAILVFILYKQKEVLINRNDE